MKNNKPMTAEEYMKYISDSNGWGKHSPLTGGYDVPTWMEMYHKHMSQSAQQQPQGSELPSVQAIAYEQWKAGVFAEWVSINLFYFGHNNKMWTTELLLEHSGCAYTTTELYNCEEFKEYLEKRRKEEGK